MNSETKLFLGILGGTITLIIGAVIFFSRPVTPLTRESLIPPTPNATGSADAKTWLVEFSDYQCPACGDFEPAVNELRNTYPNDLYLVYRNFPLSQHPFAQPAAQTAEAAALQGKFWEMHDLLFEKQDIFSDSTWEESATQLGLDMEKFRTDMSSDTVLNRIAADQSYGGSIGVNSTPTFYLNGLKMNFSSLDDFVSQIEKSIGK